MEQLVQGKTTTVTGNQPEVILASLMNAMHFNPVRRVVSRRKEHTAQSGASLLPARKDWNRRAVVLLNVFDVIPVTHHALARGEPLGQKPLLGP